MARRVPRRSRPARDFEEQFRQVLHRVVSRKHNPVYWKAPGRVKDSDVFTFWFSQKQADEFYKEDAAFFPAPSGGKHKLKFTRTFKEVKEFFRRALDGSYCHHAAKATGRKCYGPLPGTYSTLEPKSVKPRLMVVPRNYKRDGANLAGYVAFYKTYFGVTEDPESRGYGTFK